VVAISVIRGYLRQPRASRRAHEPVGAVERRQLLGDLGPRLLACLRIKAGEHLVEGAEGLTFEEHAVGGAWKMKG
jgi:hypothetical protein